MALQYTHTQRKRDRKRPKLSQWQSKQKHPHNFLSVNAAVCPSISQLGWGESRFIGRVADMIIVWKRVDVMEIDIRKIIKIQTTDSTDLAVEETATDRGKVKCLISAAATENMSITDSVCLNSTLNTTTLAYSEVAQLEWVSAQENVEIVTRELPLPLILTRLCNICNLHVTIIWEMWHSHLSSACELCLQITFVERYSFEFPHFSEKEILFFQTTNQDNGSPECQKVR